MLFRSAALLGAVAMLAVVVPELSSAAEVTKLPPRRPVALPSPPHSTFPLPSMPSPAESENKTETPSDKSGEACLTSLRNRYGAAIKAVPLPPGDPACAVAEPVEVGAVSVRVGSQGERRSIALHPPATLSCAMAGSVAEWLEISVQPLARGFYGQDVSSLRVGGGHECRRRNRTSGGPVSEHATGRALDIFAIELGSAGAQTEIVVGRPGDHDLFVKALRHAACGAFMTALGPGSDAAHSDHLHVDIQPRRASSRFCQ